jgi:NADPH2:quinone reductase
VNAAEAATLPECVFTVWANVFAIGGLEAEETLLVHGGSSGIGHMAIQMAKALGAKVIVTVGSQEKAEFCKNLGADSAINYKEKDFVVEVLSLTNQKGVDVVLDMVGGDYVARNIQVLAPFGRHVSIAMQHGSKAQIDLRAIMTKRLVITGSTLRPRPLEVKAHLARQIEEKIWPLIEKNQLKPQVFRVLPLEKAMEAHNLMEKGQHLGKIALTME